MSSNNSSKYEKDSILALLEELGLSENEARVYKASIALGPTTIQKIAFHSSLKRTTVYSVSESLKQKGLMMITIDGMKKKYASQDPQFLEILLEERKRRLQKALPQLSTMFNQQGEEGVIKYFDGLEAVKTVYESLIRDIKPKQEYMVVADQSKWLELDPEYYRGFTERRAKLDINIRLLLTDTPRAREWKQFSKNFNVTVKILPKSFDFSTDMVITPQRLLLHNLELPIFGVTITNKNIINMQQQLFEMLWASSSEDTE